ncbi:hypothetical protein KFV02_05455 [Desulfohalobiaceae bacterium Ax17]|jgi:IS5 family transposase|nr:hypothetical protein [Desulfovulcanus ferrireducens]MBT8763373.1 hypothetical protein [Desulfovulcanus ferrireducens]
MQTTMPKIKQRVFLYPDLMDQLNPKHPLIILSKKIPWERIKTITGILVR